MAGTDVESAIVPPFITAAYVSERITAVTGVEVHIEEVVLTRFGSGTSGAQTWRVVPRPVADGVPEALILKIVSGSARTERGFYKDLAPSLPVSTPRLYGDGGLEDGRTWLLMEELPRIRDVRSWTEADARSIVSDIAALHAAHWGQTHALQHDWLRDTGEGTGNLQPRLTQIVEAAAVSALPVVAPEIFGLKRLQLLRAVVSTPELAEALTAPGLTLVHGDTWHFNLPILMDGRRFMIDWETVHIGSGFWEIAYFENLLRVLSETEFRTEIPLAGDNVLTAYLGGLASHGVAVDHAVARRAFLAGCVAHPILHWLRQLTPAPESKLREVLAVPEARDFLAVTFGRWEETAKALGLA